MSRAGVQSRGNGIRSAPGSLRGRKGIAATGAFLAAGMVLAVVLAAPRAARAGGLNLNGGSQGYLGVGMRDVGEDQIKTLKLKETRGAEVLSVDHDGPAGKIGLRVHDVILQMNGEAIQGQEQLRRMLHETPAGRTVTLVISRDGQQQTLQTQLANREEVERRAWQEHLTVPDPASGEPLTAEPGPAPAGPAPGGRNGGTSAPGSMGFLHGGLTGRTHNLLSLGSPYTGAMLEPVGAQLAQFFGVGDGTGLLVKNVDNNSPAAIAGLHAGDVVVKANQVTLSTPGDWSRIMHESKGKSVALTIMRDKREQTLSLTPDPKRRSAMEWPFAAGFADTPAIETGALVAALPRVDLPQDDIGRPGEMLQTDDLCTLLDEAKRHAPREADLQTMIDNAQRNTPSAADLKKMLDEAKRSMPDQAQLQHMIDEARRQGEAPDLHQELDRLPRQFGPGSPFDRQIHELREQMMLSMPGSMD